MQLTPREKDKLLIAMAAEVARKRLSRGVKLNHPEAVAWLSFLVLEGARDGRTVAELMAEGTTWLSRDQVMEAYPVSKSQRRERFAEVMAGMRDYSAEELDGELLDLFATHQALGGSGRSGAEGFLAQLRTRAKTLGATESSEAVQG